MSRGGGRGVRDAGGGRPGPWDGARVVPLRRGPEGAATAGKRGLGTARGGRPSPAAPSGRRIASFPDRPGTPGVRARARSGSAPAKPPAFARRLAALGDAARRRDWMAFAEQLTWTGVAGVAGFGAGIVVGLLVTAASMGPAWVGHPVLATAALLRRLPVPSAVSGLAVLALGFALARLSVFGRPLLVLARIAVAVLAVAIAYRVIVG